MKQHSIGSGFMVGVFFGASLLCGAPAQDGQFGSASHPTATTTELKQGEAAKPNAASNQHDEGAPEQKAGGAANYAAGVGEILQMIQAGVSTEVIKAYIENSPIAYSLSASDIIALKNHTVPDDLTTAMLKRGASLRSQTSQTNHLVAVPLASLRASPRYGALDPESYEYFQYYYLYPRTLAAANERLYSPYSSFPGFAPYSYGYYGVSPFQPFPPSAFRRP
jgi:hypothetical protein